MIETQMMNLVMDGKIMAKTGEDGEMIYLSQYYSMELNTAKMLWDLNVDYKVSDEELASTIETVEGKSEMKLDTMQKKAIEAAARNGIVVITGGRCGGCAGNGA